MNKIIIPVLASILILGFIGVQDVYAPDDQPENLTLGGTGYNSDSDPPGFEIKVLVHLPKDANHERYSVNISIEFEDGSLARANGIPVPVGVAEGGNNSSVHKLVAKVPYDVPPDLDGEKVRIKITAKLLEGEDVKVERSQFKWAHFPIHG